jgi:hypothetical protein
MANGVFTQHRAIFVLIILLSVNSLLAQNEKPRLPAQSNSFWNNVRYGGSLGLSFGNGGFTGALAPSAIYDFNRYFSSGLVLSGAYTSQGSFKATSLGGSVIGMFRPIKEIQLSTEYEQLNINRRYEFDGGTFREQEWVPALFLGIGFNTGPVVTGVRYDVLHDENKSFYSSAFMPFVSVYF